MTQKDGSDAYSARASIDAGFSFALAAFAIGLGLLGVLARVGLPGALLHFCVWAIIFAGLVVIAVRLRTMRPGEFYAGGRNLPPAYAALAYAGLAAGLFLAFLPPLLPGVGFASLATGFAAGLTCALCVTGPYLRRSAAFSIADLVGTRFPHPLVRCAIAMIAAGCAVFVALAGFDIALRAFIATTGVGRSLGIAIVGLLLVLLIVPGGLSGVIWLAAGAMIVSLAALGLPAALNIFHESPLWLSGTARFAEMSGASSAPAFSPTIALALALGLSALTPLFGPSVASGGRIPALRAGPLAVFFLGALALLSVLTLMRATHAPDIPPNATAASLLESLPDLLHLGAVLAGLASVFAMTLGIAVAAAGIQSFTTSLGHDIYHPDRRRFGPVSRRLAVARALTILLIVLCAAFLEHHRADPRNLILLATIFSASLVAPVLALTLIKRVIAFDAAAALAVAIALMAHFFFTHRQGWPVVGLAGNALFAALDAAFAGFFASLLHGRAIAPAGPALPPPGQLVGPD